MGTAHRSVVGRWPLVVAIALVLVIAGCRQDMHDQPRMKPLRRNDFFEDAREGRPLVAGTVYRNQTNIAGTFAGGPFILGKNGDVVDAEFRNIDDRKP